MKQRFKNLVTHLFLMGLPITGLFMIALSEKSENHREVYTQEKTRPAPHEVKKCKHILNNRFCRWCRDYRMHPENYAN